DREQEERHVRDGGARDQLDDRHASGIWRRQEGAGDARADQVRQQTAAAHHQSNPLADRKRTGSGTSAIVPTTTAIAVASSQPIAGTRRATTSSSASLARSRG